MSHASTMDLSTALARLGNDAELLEELIQIFREDAPVLMQKIRGAAEDGDFEEARRAAHTLKGLSANLDAHGVVAAAQTVESETTVTLAAMEPLVKTLDIELSKGFDELAQRA